MIHSNINTENHGLVEGQYVTLKFSDKISIYAYIFVIGQNKHCPVIKLQCKDTNFHHQTRDSCRLESMTSVALQTLA